MFPEAESKYDVPVVMMKATHAQRTTNPIPKGNPLIAIFNTAVSGVILGNITIAAVAKVIVNPITRTLPTKKPIVEFLAVFHPLLQQIADTCFDHQVSIKTKVRNILIIASY